MTKQDKKKILRTADNWTCAEVYFNDCVITELTPIFSGRTLSYEN